MAEQHIHGEFYKGNAFTETNLIKAVDAYMVDPKVTEFPMTGGLMLDLSKAVQVSAHARRVLDDPDANMMRRRGVVRAAIPLARPVLG